MSKEVKNHIFRCNWIFRHTICINNPHWQSGGIIIFLCKYFIVISDILLGTFLHVLFLMLAVILQGYLRNQEGIRIELQKKVHERICVRDITFFTARPPFYVTFYPFLCLSLPLSKWRTCWMVPIKIHNIAMEGILCDDIMSERSKIWRYLIYLAT